MNLATTTTTEDTGTTEQSGSRQLIAGGVIRPMKNRAGEFTGRRTVDARSETGRECSITPVGAPSVTAFRKAVRPQDQSLTGGAR